MRLLFSENPKSDKASVLVNGLTTLTKMAINRQVDSGKANAISTKFSIAVEDSYAELNEELKSKLLAFSGEKANLMEDIDLSTKEGLTDAFSFNAFERTFFTIQTRALATVLADTEAAQVMDFINIDGVGIGDSMTYNLNTRALYEVEDAAYGASVGRAREHFSKPITVTPSPKQASVQFDFMQMLNPNYDFGAEMAKIVLSIRAKQYQDGVDLLFNSTPLTGTPFYQDTFNMTNYTDLAETVEAVNGANVRAYGTRRAFSTASGSVTNGFSVLDEIAKTTYIDNLFGVPSSILRQSVYVNDASFAKRVPNDKILLLSDMGEAPIKMVQENYMDVELVTDNVTKRDTYQYTYSYDMQMVTSSVYGIIDL